MIYTLVLQKNTAYSNSGMAHLPDKVKQAWDTVFSDENMAKYGVKWVVYCDATWANEAYGVFAINSYTDIPARLAHWKEIEKAAWYEYVDLITLMGTSNEEPQQPSFPNPIIQLYMIHNDPAAVANSARLTKEEEEALWEKLKDSVKRNGGCPILYCDSFWADEDTLGFGVIAWPTVEARQAHARDELELHWNQYVSAFSLLGIPRA